MYSIQRKEYTVHSIQCTVQYLLAVCPGPRERAGLGWAGDRLLSSIFHFFHLRLIARDLDNAIVNLLSLLHCVPFDMAAGLADEFLLSSQPPAAKWEVAERGKQR